MGWGAGAIRDGMAGLCNGGLPFGVERRRLESVRHNRREPVGMRRVKPNQGAQSGDQAGERMVAGSGTRARTG